MNCPSITEILLHLQTDSTKKPCELKVWMVAEGHLVELGESIGFLRERSIMLITVSKHLGMPITASKHSNMHITISKHSSPSPKLTVHLDPHPSMQSSPDKSSGHPWDDASWLAAAHNLAFSFSSILKEVTELDPSVHANVIKDKTDKVDNKDDATKNTTGNCWLAGC